MKRITTVTLALAVTVAGMAGMGVVAGSAASSELEIVEMNLAYEPDELTATVGQTIRLTNQDPFFHQTRVSLMNADGSAKTIVVKEHIEKKNTSQTFTPAHKGDYQIRCMVHDGMEATLHVN